MVVWLGSVRKKRGRTEIAVISGSFYGRHNSPDIYYALFSIQFWFGLSRLVGLGLVAGGRSEFVE